jgi:hypothetical protein
MLVDARWIDEWSAAHMNARANSEPHAGRARRACALHVGGCAVMVVVWCAGCVEWSDEQATWPAKRRGRRNSTQAHERFHEIRPPIRGRFSQNARKSSLFSLARAFCLRAAPKRSKNRKKVGGTGVRRRGGYITFANRAATSDQFTMSHHAPM